MSFARNVWQTLSAVDVSRLTSAKKIGGTELTYLSWVDAWTILMEHYPESYYEFDPERTLDNGTVEVRCTVTVADADQRLSRSMWLPVMANNLSSETNPTTRKISDARMRCLVKTLAMFGLGVALYSKEDIPGYLNAEPDYSPEVAEKYLHYRDMGTPLEFFAFLRSLPDNARSALHQLDLKGVGGPGKDVSKEKEMAGAAKFQEYEQEFADADEFYAQQLWDELTSLEQHILKRFKPEVTA